LLAAIVAATPQASGVLFDLPQVVAGAPALLAEYHVEDRVRIVEGSFFDTVPDGGDAYVLKNVIHDWSDDEAAQILANVRAAAGAGKTVLLVELVIPRHDREFVGKWLDLEMLLAQAARERTAAEYEQLLKRGLPPDPDRRSGVTAQRRRGDSCLSDLSGLAKNFFWPGGNSRMNYLVFVLVAVIGSAMSRYGSAPTARSNMLTRPLEEP
jgi:hypothetical protein